MFTEVLRANPTLADRFGWLLRGLYYMLGLEFRRVRIGQPMETAIFVRLTGLARRMNAAFAKWQAGTLRAAPGRKGSSPLPPDQVRGRLSPRRGEGEEAVGRTGKACAWGMLPRRYGWLKRLLPLAGGEMNAFDVWLAEPELKAMLAAAPQVGRILRPLCHMFGLELPAELRLPQRKRRARGDPSHKVRGTQKAPPMPRRRDFSNPRDEALAWLRWSEATGKPVDPRRMSAVGFGYVLHWPRDGNRPPPEIGYGGRVFPPLAKDYEWPKD